MRVALAFSLLIVAVLAVIYALTRVVGVITHMLVSRPMPIP